MREGVATPGEQADGVAQAGGDLAWGSALWIDYEK